MIRRFLLLLLCLFSLQSCMPDSPPQEYTIIHYPSTQSVLEVFEQRKADFDQMSQLLYDKGDFFFEMDGGLLSHTDFADSPYLTPEEGQTIKEFMAETGLYSIERFPVTVEQGFADERTGILLVYTFYCNDEKTTCAIASLSTPEDKAIEAHMLYLHYEQIARIIDMEMQELGNGWYFFIYRCEH